MTTDIDFFSADAAGAMPEAKAPDASATSAARTPVAEQTPKPKKARRQIRVNGKHLLIVGVLLVAGWVAWPLLGGSNYQTMPMGTPLPASPAGNVVPQPQAQVSVAASAAPTPAPRTADVEQKDSEARDGDEIAALKAALALQEERQEVLQQVMLAGQQELKANLAVLMAQVKQLNDAAEANKAAKAPPPAPAAAPKRAARPALPKAPGSVPGLKLNTVYPGQAWIDAPQGKTYIVQVGDVVEGARVLSIDEGARVVQTTRGPIQ